MDQGVQVLARITPEARRACSAGSVRSNWNCWKERWMTYSMLRPLPSARRSRLSSV